MPDFTYIVAVGRLGITAADGIDADEDPDTIWCDEGVVRFTPLNTYTKVTSGAPMPWTAGHSVIDVPIDTSGYLSLSGTARVKFIDLTSVQRQPADRGGQGDALGGVPRHQGAGHTGRVPSVNVRIAADTAVALSSSAAATALGLTVGTRSAT
jgi:hypothetical protein